MKLEIEMLQNQNDMIKKKMHNLDVKFKLAKLKKMHLSLKLKEEFGVDFK